MESTILAIWMHRLCGLEGDKIEVKHGALYVNDIYSDSILPLSHDYYLLATEFEKIKDNAHYDDFEVQYFGNDSVLTYVSDKILNQCSIPKRIKIIPKDSVNELILEKYKQNWNADNFGPVTVPKGTYFVLGDNRSRSLDSRYTGFIEKKKFAGTVLFH